MIIQQKREMVEQEVRVFDVPLWHKLTLTIREAAAYSGIGEKRLRELCQSHPSFILNVGTKTLIKRIPFEEYIERSSVL